MVDLTVKTTGERARKIQAVEAGRGLAAYRKVPSWYNAVSASTVHDMRLKIMHPNAATKEDEVADILEEWRATYMELQLLDTMFEEFPEE